MDTNIPDQNIGPFRDLVSVERVFDPRFIPGNGFGKWQYEAARNTLSPESDNGFSITSSLGASSYQIPVNDARFYTQKDVRDILMSRGRIAVEQLEMRVALRIQGVIDDYRTLSSAERDRLVTRLRDIVSEYRGEVVRILESLDESKIRRFAEKGAPNMGGGISKELVLPDISSLLERVRTLEEHIRVAIQKLDTILRDHGITDRASLQSVLRSEFGKIIDQREGESIRDALSRGLTERTENTRANREMLVNFGNKLGLVIGGVSIGGTTKGKAGVIVRDTDGRILLVTQERAEDGKKSYNFTYGNSVESILDAYAKATGRFIAIHHSVEPVSGRGEGTLSTPLSKWVSGVLNLDLDMAITDPRTIPDGIDIIFYNNHKKVVLNKSFGKDWYVKLGITESERDSIKAQSIFTTLGMKGEILGGGYILEGTFTGANFSDNNSSSTYSGIRLAGKWSRSILDMGPLHSSIESSGAIAGQTNGFYEKRGFQTGDIRGGLSLRTEFHPEEGIWKTWFLIGKEWFLSPHDVYDKHKLPLQFGEMNVIGVGGEYGFSDSSRIGGGYKITDGEFTHKKELNIIYKIPSGAILELGQKETRHGFSFGDIHQRSLSLGTTILINGRPVSMLHNRNIHGGQSYSYTGVSVNIQF